MDIRYPVRKADGRDYKTYNELLTDIRKNAHGWWLLGVNRYWHGGIHIGASSSPASVLNQDMPEKSVPLQFMMDGEVVAWRVNRDYANIECYQERPLRQSGTFVLVKSVYKPDEQDESSWLTLYQLYMHTAPLSEYPKRSLYRVTQKGHGVRMRKHSCHDDSREIVPDVLENKHGHARTLRQGDTLAVLQQKSFLLKQQPEPFALVQRLQDGKPAGETFWISVRPEYLEPDGECYVCLPDWMHSALNHGVFDDVVVPSAPLKVTVKAGEPVGFLGAQDLTDEDTYPQTITTEYKAHIELLSLDEHVPDVVANVKGIKTGKQFIKLKLKRPLYLRRGRGDESTFEQMSVITLADAGKIIPRDATSPFIDKTGTTYFQIRPHTWMHQDDVEQLSQHDLAGLNFYCIKAEPTTDFTRTLDERWLTEALKSINSHFDSAKGPQFAQAKMFYESLIRRAENRRPPRLYPDISDDEQLFGALHSNQMNIPEYARRLIVKHDSEWDSSPADTRWASVFNGQEESHSVTMANRAFLEATRWMNKVPPFASQRAVWHFHPLEFLEILRSTEFPRTPVNGELTPVEFIQFYNGEKIDDADYEEAAKELDCEVAAIKAVAKTETGPDGSYFKFENNDDYVPAILFERHHFHKYTNGKYDQFEDISNPVAGGYGATSIQYEKLMRAYALDKTSALQSASWGKFQILASNYVTAGYASPEDFVFALSKSEKNQLKAFVSFIKADRVLLRSIRNKDWISFSQRYNGPRQKGYDLKMERNYNALL
ncbi:N-acetylmuramidase family protein [Cronobacter dublinensis]|uniref:N-acetylmuramidase family protein n=2 Tax=Cronobacter dublinensis TaxID=413497 RepID=UPI0024AFFF7D|nr:N-acetylmuramidase family protein [Cronobacter dublinensis]EKY3088673.1 N-acetylmuramidase family protein [Cronobacter dublinensis]ELQ6229802.1 N-acetylmuramidase family protein [Cronobacter dublinensis]ELY4005629.1 N-acetylmuramidase family protein [Cronobacter dublinensis]ELY4407435.1 N-acetylmuramidase family protein [Cronobacter dublinensis]ELY5818983.1 N-acetylmuramidase family protein [Cronobacter dublinensis]